MILLVSTPQPSARQAASVQGGSRHCRRKGTLVSTSKGLEKPELRKPGEQAQCMWEGAWSQEFIYVGLDSKALPEKRRTRNKNSSQRWWRHSQSLLPLPRGDQSATKTFSFRLTGPTCAIISPVDTVSNVTRSLQNPPLLRIRFVTYSRDSRTKSCAFDG